MTLIPSLTLLALFLAACTAAVAQPAPPATQILTADAATALVRRIASAGGCGTDLCFALDGSGSITRAEFALEKAVVGDVAAVVSATRSPALAAVQSGSSTTSISSLTSDGAAFRAALAGAAQLGGQSFTVGGLNFCVRELVGRAPLGTIVLLGDGLSNLGASVPARAGLFRAVGGDVVVVAAGAPDEGELLQVVGNDESKVFSVAAFRNVASLRGVVERLVEKICRLPADNFTAPADNSTAPSVDVKPEPVETPEASPTPEESVEPSSEASPDV